MTCDHCGGLGLVIQPWTNAPHDYAVCLCSAGQAMRKADNNGKPCLPLWRVWCVKWQVDQARMFLLEDVYTAAELAAVGLAKRSAIVNREAALIANGRKAKR